MVVHQTEYRLELMKPQSETQDVMPDVFAFSNQISNIFLWFAFIDGKLMGVVSSCIKLLSN